MQTLQTAGYTSTPEIKYVTKGNNHLSQIRALIQEKRKAK